MLLEELKNICNDEIKSQNLLFFKEHPQFLFPVNVLKNDIKGLNEIVRHFGSNFDPYDVSFLGLNWGVYRQTICNAFYDSLNKSCDMKSNLLKLKEHSINYYDYLEKSKIDIRNQNADYNLIVPISNRHDHTEIFLHRCTHLVPKEKWCVTFIIQENNHDLFEKINQWCPESYRNNINVISLECDSKIMNRSLCYNLVAMIVNSKWIINHDIDLLFNENFISLVEERAFDPEVTWFQPFQGSRVILLDENSSNHIGTLIKEGNHFEIKIPEHLSFPMNNTPHEVGAPGGSIVVKRDDFLSFGGYDPEFLSGYGPEDALFWYKLECFYGGSEEHKEISKTPFRKENVKPFSHDSGVDLYHMFHEPSECDVRNVYLNLYSTFWIRNFSDEDFVSKYLSFGLNEIELEYHKQ